MVHWLVVLLVQECSGHVLNATRQLAVIPKGFHKPIADYRADAPVGATLRREMEEELFGRSDIDITVCRHIAAVPMHPSRLSEPMRWLTGVPDALRMECTQDSRHYPRPEYQNRPLSAPEAPGGLPVTARVSGDALTVLHTVIADWPIT